MNKQLSVKLSLIFYDLLIFFGVFMGMLVVYGGTFPVSPMGVAQQMLLSLAAIFGVRIFGKIYRQIWRYGGIQCYIRFLVCDAAGWLLYFLLERFLPVEHISFPRLLAVCTLNTLLSLAMRMVYRFAYKCGSRDDRLGLVLRWMLRIFAAGRVNTEPDPNSQKIKAAIIGAGSVGVGLAEDMLSNPRSQFVPRCFVDSIPDKVGREIHGLPVFLEDDAVLDSLREHQIQEVIFAVPNMEAERKVELYDFYRRAGFRIKVFDYPVMDIPGKKRSLREFEISDLLFRGEKDIISEKTRSYYRDKVILITGGGGSIGSELCRQLAKMGPKQLIILDIYENCAYEVQQSILFAYKGSVDIRVEIASIRDEKAVARVFERYHPAICINAAAHKHVPLMENNCVEAVENNIFGALNVIRCCERFGCGRFMMVSTDKAVNPTNIMGATKRFCEMITQAYSTRGQVRCSSTRFGNVLGSAGSVIPLFRRQIAAGGPVTVTDRRVIRYFMTIPEASQLVLTSGAMAENGDLFVLDMGKPVKIWELAESMIAMSGVQGIEIVETGLRPGEKLYEELLVDKNDLRRTDNDLIYIEHEEPVTMGELDARLALLREACEAGSDDGVRAALHAVVPTFRTPEEVNG